MPASHPAELFQTETSFKSLFFFTKRENDVQAHEPDAGILFLEMMRHE